MFLASHFPPPLPSTATSISLEASAAASPATTAAMEHIDSLIRKALGRSTYGIPDAIPKPWYMIDSDDVIAFIAMAAFFLGVFLALLAIKLVLGMLLLRYARSRYQTMNAREKVSLDTKGKRIGGFGITEMDEEKKAIIYEDDPEGYMKMKEREKKWEQKAREERGGVGEFENVRRYEMATKRIW
jgi:membrane protein implicated in regulation of membrane protease activity